MTKEQFIEHFNDDGKYPGHHIKKLIEDVELSIPCSKLKKGDVFKMKLGNKPRPLVVLSILKNEGLVLAAPLSSTEDEYNICSHNSRFFKREKNFIGHGIIAVKIEYVENNLLGVLDDNKAVNFVIKYNKELINRYL